MRTIQQKRQLPGNPHWTGTAQATSLPDKDAAHCNKRLILFSLDFPARQGRRRPRSSRIPYPKRHGGIVRRTRTLDLAPPKQRKRNSPSFRGTPRHRKAKIARGWQDLRTMHGLRGLCSGDSLARFGGPCSGGPGNIRAPCMIRGVSAAKRAPPWQDLRAMHSRKAICSAFRIHGARILPKPARFGCTAAICCQGGALFPSEAPSGMHEARKLPRMAARERTTAKSYHRQTPGNAFREHPAVAELPRAHRGGVRCHGAGLRGAHHGEILPPSNVGGAARKAASRSGSTRKADLLAGIHKSGSQGTAARRDSRGGSTRTSGSHAGFEGRLDTQDTAARREFARRPQRVREAARRAKPTGHKKAPLRRTAPSPQNYGRKPDPP